MSLNIATIVDRCNEPGNQNRRIIKLTDKIVVKRNATPEEVANQNYAYLTCMQSDCGLRIPKVYGYFIQLEIGYLVMEFIDGTSLIDIIIARKFFDLQCLATAIHTLATRMQQSFPGPANHGLPRGYLFSDDGAETNFTSIESLNSWLNERALFVDDEPVFKFELSDCVFCHLDLASRNIIVLPDGSFGLLDWEYAGFYPKAFETYCLRFIAQNQDYNSSFAQSLSEALENISPQKTSDKLICMLDRVYGNNQR